MSLGARLLSSATAALFVASPTQATVINIPASAGDGAAVLEATLQPAGPAPKMQSLGELTDFASQIDIDYPQTFDIDPGPIAALVATADLTQIASLAADVNLSAVDRNFHFQNTDLAANGLGPTRLVKRAGFALGSGFDFGLLRVFLLILVTILVALAFARWKID